MGPNMAPRGSKRVILAQKGQKGSFWAYWPKGGPMAHRGSEGMGARPGAKGNMTLLALLAPFGPKGPK
jgi:hypothetical protein